jgi:dienelactone hydrolase
MAAESTTPRREDVSFDSGGQQCAAWLYRPARGDELPAPCVVMAHGFSGTRELGLDRLAERFAQAGLASLVFDYRHFGDSQGEPRQLLDISRQLGDYAAAVEYARGIAGVDPWRIAVWGTALSSGHALVTASRDHTIAAVVAQLPYLAANPGAVSPLTTVQFFADAVLDQVKHWLGRPPRMIDVVAEPGSSRRAVLMGEELVEGFRAVIPPNSKWRNTVTARFMLRLPLYRPGRYLNRITCPVLFCVAERDAIYPADAAIAAAPQLRCGEVKRYQINHFEIGRDENFDRAAADQSEFLMRHMLQTPGRDT